MFHCLLKNKTKLKKEKQKQLEEAIYNYLFTVRLINFVDFVNPNLQPVYYQQILKPGIIKIIINKWCTSSKIQVELNDIMNWLLEEAIKNKKLSTLFNNKKIIETYFYHNNKIHFFCKKVLSFIHNYQKMTDHSIVTKALFLDNLSSNFSHYLKQLSEDKIVFSNEQKEHIFMNLCLQRAIQKNKSLVFELPEAPINFLDDNLTTHELITLQILFEVYHYDVINPFKNQSEKTYLKTLTEYKKDIKQFARKYNLLINDASTKEGLHIILNWNETRECLWLRQV